MIAVIDYGIGNLRSAEKALAHVGGNAQLVTEPASLEGVAGVVLPGVGAYGACASALQRAGFVEPLRALIENNVPFLGLCVGFQLLFASSEESPGSKGLGVFAGTVRRLASNVKLPQMQWNTAIGTGRVINMTAGLPDEPWFYFVHSYAPMQSDVDAEDVALVSDYGENFVAAIERGRLWGTQFHPEKSGSVGLRLLANFVSLCDTKGAAA